MKYREDNATHDKQSYAIKILHHLSEKRKKEKQWKNKNYTTVSIREKKNNSR